MNVALHGNAGLQQPEQLHPTSIMPEVRKSPQDPRAAVRAIVSGYFLHLQELQKQQARHLCQLSPLQQMTLVCLCSQSCV